MGIKENILGTEEQNRIAQKNLDKQASEGSALAKALGGKKTGDKIGEEVFKEDIQKGWLSQPISERIDRASQKAKEAEDEAKRESTRGLPGKEKPMKKGGSVSSASKRADGIAMKGKTRGKIC